jgi:hypothetical protein
LGAQLDVENLLEKLQEIEQQARLVLDEMIAVPSVHRARLLHIIAIVQQLMAQSDPPR